MLAKSSVRGAALPAAPYEKIVQTILGSNYELSVVAATPAMARDFNKKYRKKSYIPDVLAFPLSKSEGEIVLNTKALAREAKKHGMKAGEYTAYIFMHACIHLTGLKHSKTMTEREVEFAKQLKLKTPLSDTKVL